MTACLHDHDDWTPAHPGGAAARHLSPDATLHALSLVREGRVLDLSHETMMGAPMNPALMTPYVIAPTVRAADNVATRRANGGENDAGATLERIGMTTHVGTHIDALGHFARGDAMYGGRSAVETIGPRGLGSLGAEHIPPMVTRGLCLDVSRLDGGSHLEAGRPVSMEELERSFTAAGVPPRPGDVICLHTGWGRYFAEDPARYVAGEPGLDLAAAKWLTDAGAVAIGADTMAVEVLPGAEFPAVQMPVHLHCLVDTGVNLIENLVLDALVADGIVEFCIVLAPVKLTGATGAPLRPLALV